MFASHLETPFGAIVLSLVASSGEIAPDTKPTLRSLPDGQLVSWSSPLLTAELLLVALQPELPEGMQVSASHAAVWRVQARAVIEGLTFEARWAPSAHPPNGGPSSGQALNAITWSDESTELSLGAPDAEGLLRYKSAGVGLPGTWRTLLDVNDPSNVRIEDYLSDGLRLRLPGLQEFEIGHTHFAVAWADADKQEDAPWFAVDLGSVVIRQCLDRMSNER